MKVFLARICLVAVAFPFLHRVGRGPQSSYTGGILTEERFALGCVRSTVAMRTSYVKYAHEGN